MFGANMTVVDKVPAEMLSLVDPHWYQFPPMNPLWHSILGFMIFCLGIVSFIGNGLVIFIFTSTKTLRTPSNLLVVNLAFSDFMMMTCMSPPMVVNCYYETWTFGRMFSNFKFKSVFLDNSFYLTNFVEIFSYNSTNVWIVWHVGIIVWMHIYLDHDLHCFRSLQRYCQRFIGKIIHLIIFKWKKNAYSPKSQQRTIDIRIVWCF